MYHLQVIKEHINRALVAYININKSTFCNLYILQVSVMTFYYTIIT